MSYNKEGNKKFNNKGNKNFKKKNDGNGNYAIDAAIRKMKEEKKNAILVSQTENLGNLKFAAEYLDRFVEDDTLTKPIKTVEVIDYLTNQIGIDGEKAKYINKFVGLLVDLANAYKNKFIKDDEERINIRTAYVREILKSSFNTILHKEIENMILRTPNLFNLYKEAENTEEESGFEPDEEVDRDLAEEEAATLDEEAENQQTPEEEE